jgi:hypothetical protein
MAQWSDVPRSVWDFRENYVRNRGGREMGLVWFLFGAVCWTLWLNRNDFIFNNKIISSPRALIFHLTSLMQHWMIASTGVDRAALECLLEEIKSHVLEELVSVGVG